MMHPYVRPLHADRRQANDRQSASPLKLYIARASHDYEAPYNLAPFTRAWKVSRGTARPTDSARPVPAVTRKDRAGTRRSRRAPVQADRRWLDFFRAQSLDVRSTSLVSSLVPSAQKAELAQRVRRSMYFRLLTFIPLVAPISCRPSAYDRAHQSLGDVR